MKLIEQHKQVWKNDKEELRTIDMGNEEIKKELKIGTLTLKEKEELIVLLRDYIDVFARSYKDMPSLDIDVVIQKVPLEEECKSIKQKMRRTHPKALIKVKAKIKK